MTHSLAEQSANLADVFSAVPVLPLAKAKIRKQAREGLPAHPGMSAVTIAALVDGFILYRYGWWAEDYSLPQDKILRHTFRESWSRRKTRPQYSDEVARTIKGRSSTTAVTPYTNLYIVNGGSGSGSVYVVFDITPVYADGSHPTEYIATMEQSASQAALLGSSIISPLPSSGAFSSTKFTCEVSITAGEIPMETGDTTQLFFDLFLTGVDRPHDGDGNDLEDVEGSVVRCKYALQIPVTVPSS
jgi:hypothetical protein